VTIPASSIVDIIPSVVSAGGSALDTVGLILTTGTRVPVGTVKSFPSSASVDSYFGATSDEAKAAAVYFSGFTNSSVLPGSVLYAQYNDADVAAYLRGGDASGLTLTQLKALSGTIILTVDGTLATSSTIDLSAATSFSNAATIIESAFTSPGFTVTYDSVSGGFVFTSSTTGASSTITEATGTLSASLYLTTATGAVLSQGAAAQTDPGAFMDSIVAVTTDWVSFMTLFDPDSSGNTLKQAFSTWTGQQSNRYAYICWDTDITPTESTDATTSLGQLLSAANTSGTCLIYAPDYNLAAFVCGSIASINFQQKNGRITFAFKSQSGLASTVTTDTAAANLLANFYNFYGSYATANQGYTWFYNGSVSGQYKWLDSYINQIWLNNSFQLALMNLLANVKSIPYNNSGYSLIRAACMDTINAGKNFGAFVGGVQLSAAQIAEVNNAAGTPIDQILSSQGWYLQILDAPAATRAARKTPPMTFWYMDGGSVQQITLNSIEVQ